MKTDYKIGEVYYYAGQKMELVSINKCDKTYPLTLIRKIDKNEFTFTLKGARIKGWKPELSTSPTEFIAPKDLDYLKIEYPISIEFDILDAIRLLNQEGYTITKQY